MSKTTTMVMPGEALPLVAVGYGRLARDKVADQAPGYVRVGAVAYRLKMGNRGFTIHREASALHEQLTRQGSNELKAEEAKAQRNLDRVVADLAKVRDEIEHPVATAPKMVAPRPVEDPNRGLRARLEASVEGAERSIKSLTSELKLMDEREKKGVRKDVTVYGEKQRQLEGAKATLKVSAAQLKEVPPAPKPAEPVEADPTVSESDRVAMLRSKEDALLREQEGYVEQLRKVEAASKARSVPEPVEAASWEFGAGRVVSVALTYGAAVEAAEPVAAKSARAPRPKAAGKKKEPVEAK